MYEVIIDVRVHGKIIASIKQSVNTVMLRTLRTLHGSTNIHLVL